MPLLHLIRLGKKPGTKRSRTTTTVFEQDTHSFRPDNIKAHHRNCHPKKWSEYKKLENVDQKEAFFQNAQRRQPSLVGFARPLKAELVFPVQKSIVDGIIQTLLDWDDGKAIDTFNHCIDGNYAFVAPGKGEFKYIVLELAGGASFERLSRSLRSMKTCFAVQHSCDRSTVPRVARALAGINLTFLYKIISAWILYRFG